MKKFLLIAVICLVGLFAAGCNRDDETGILFYPQPVTKENILHASRTFESGKRIYYLFYSHKKIDAEFIRVQLFKAGDKIPKGGYSVLWAKDYRIMKNNSYYYYDKFTVYQEGRYVMQVFSVDDISKPLAWNYFYVY